MSLKITSNRVLISLSRFASSAESQHDGAKVVRVFVENETLHLFRFQQRREGSSGSHGLDADLLLDLLVAVDHVVEQFTAVDHLGQVVHGIGQQLAFFGEYLQRLGDVWRVWQFDSEQLIDGLVEVQLTEHAQCVQDAVLQLFDFARRGPARLGCRDSSGGGGDSTRCARCARGGLALDGGGQCAALALDGTARTQRELQLIHHVRELFEQQIDNRTDTAAQLCAAQLDERVEHDAAASRRRELMVAQSIAHSLHQLTDRGHVRHAR